MWPAMAASLAFLALLPGSKRWRFLTNIKTTSKHGYLKTMTFNLLISAERADNDVDKLKNDLVWCAVDLYCQERTIYNETMQPA